MTPRSARIHPVRNQPVMIIHPDDGPNIIKRDFVEGLMLSVREGQRHEREKESNSGLLHTNLEQQSGHIQVLHKCSPPRRPVTQTSTPRRGVGITARKHRWARPSSGRTVDKAWPPAAPATSRGAHPAAATAATQHLARRRQITVIGAWRALAAVAAPVEQVATPIVSFAAAAVSCSHHLPLHLLAPRRK